MTVERSREDLRSGMSVARANGETVEGDMLTERPENDDPQDQGGERESRRAATLSPQIRDRIALQLRSMYDSVASQPVPDRFADLIARLDANDREPG